MGSGQSAPALGEAFRCVRVHEESPASKAGLRSYFDWIVCANDTPLNQADDTFFSMIKSHEGLELRLTVFSVQTWRMRQVVIVPTRSWGGEGMLGVTIRYESIQDISDQVFHVLEVADGSPAALAGLQPTADFVLGMTTGRFRDYDHLVAEVEAAVGNTLTLVVYDKQIDSIREVNLAPRRDWGGQGLTGCDFGTGLLHRLPFVMPEQDELSSRLAGMTIGKTTAQSSSDEQTPKNNVENSTLTEGSSKQLDRLEAPATVVESASQGASSTSTLTGTDLQSPAKVASDLVVETMSTPKTVSGSSTPVQDKAGIADADNQNTHANE